MTEDAGLALYALFMYLAAFAVEAIIVFLIVRFVKNRNRERAEQQAAEQSHITPLDLSDPTCKNLADEVVQVMDDFLKAAYAARIIPDHGLVIYVQPHRIQFSSGISIASYGMCISMGSINSSEEGFEQRYSGSDEFRETLNHFIDQYRFCYDRGIKMYNYHTKSAVTLPVDNKQALKVLETLLREQILLRCPLVKVYPTSSAIMEFCAKNINDY